LHIYYILEDDLHMNYILKDHLHIYYILEDDLHMNYILKEHLAMDHFHDNQLHQLHVHILVVDDLHYINKNWSILTNITIF